MITYSLTVDLSCSELEIYQNNNELFMFLSFEIFIVVYLCSVLASVFR